MFSVFRHSATLIDHIDHFVRRHQLHRPARAFLALLVIMALRGLVDDTFHAFGGSPRAGMYFDPGDRYADLVKVALTYRDFFAETIRSGAYAHWPKVFQTWLFNNDYDNSVANLANLATDKYTTLHVPPLATVMYVFAARMMAVVGPIWVLVAFYLPYLLGAGGITLAHARVNRVARPVVWFTLFLLCLSYPALWMLNRGNIAGGYAALASFVYLVSQRSGRFRWLGWVALALATNLRPEPALLALLELTGPAPLSRKVVSMAIPGALSVGLLVASVGVAHAVYPLYTLDHARAGMAIYHHLYILSDKGDAWNSSLLFIVKLLRLGLNIEPAFSQTAQTIAVALSFAALAWGSLMALKGRITSLEWLFFLTALPVMCVPVLAYYHLLPLVLVAALLVHDLAKTPLQDDDSRPALLGLTGLVISPLAGGFTNGPLDAILLLIGCGYVLARGKAGERNAPAARAQRQIARELVS